MTTQPQYQTISPEALVAAPGVESLAPLILDFDETLWLRNSTEEFLRASAQGGLARLGLRLVESFGPWRLARRRETRMHFRDWMRVGVVLLAKPGALQDWAVTAQDLAKTHINPPLWDLAMQQAERRVIVVSNGFVPVLRILLDAMGAGRFELVAAPASTGAFWRIKGKLRQANAILGAETVRAAVMITDSEDDADILSAVAHGYVVRWPDAQYAPFRAARQG